MNKKLNKRIIVAGVIALLLIWVCLAFNNFDWAVLYAWILIGGGIMVVVAANIVVLAAKNGENEMFEPKITKEEMLEFVKDKGMIMSWEDINAMKVSREDILSNDVVRPRPLDSNEISKALQGMGYKVDGVENGFIKFNDGEDKYSLYSDWIHRYQMNCIGIFKTYTVDQDDVEEMIRIVPEISGNIRIVKLRVFPYGDNTDFYRLELSADSFYSDSTSLNATILALMDFINEALDRLRKEVPRRSEDDSTIDFNDVQQQMTLNQNKKTKYEC